MMNIIFEIVNMVEMIILMKFDPMRHVANNNCDATAVLLLFLIHYCHVCHDDGKEQKKIRKRTKIKKERELQKLLSNTCYEFCIHIARKYYERGVTNLVKILKILIRTQIHLRDKGNFHNN